MTPEEIIEELQNRTSYTLIELAVRDLAKQVVLIKSRVEALEKGGPKPGTIGVAKPGIVFVKAGEGTVVKVQNCYGACHQMPAGTPWTCSCPCH